MNRRCLGFAVLLVPLFAAGVRAQSTQDLKRMTLEDLLRVPVTTVSRVPDQIATVPAAVFVLTADDIRRSGATSVPEALRLVPGLQVARINAGTWAVGVRGFADRLARSILVLIDGRSVYSPLFAGTYWETQDVLLADIDRIEVIRGPGGTLWGANAVNGIINIITRPAAGTQGWLVTAGGGSTDRGFGAVRYGGTAANVSYRVYAKGFDRAPEFHAGGAPYDEWRAGQGGFRADWRLPASRSFTLEGDAYYGELGVESSVTSYTRPFAMLAMRDNPLAGGHVLARLGGESRGRRDYQLQVYYDHTSRDERPVGENRDTLDLDFQDTVFGWTRHTFIWGAGYRLTSGDITAVATSAFAPPRRTDHLYTAFVHDEMALHGYDWLLTLGTKVEHNDYSGVEFQPSARLLWTIDPARDTSLFWAVTRAVRTPSRVETDYTTTSFVRDAGLPTFVRLLPNPAFEPEKLVAYEAGVRSLLAGSLYVTAALFYNDLEDTLSTELLAAFVEAGPPARLILPVQFANGIEGRSHGAELTADLRPKPWWRIRANYSYLSVQATKKPGSRDVSQEQRYEGLVPHHQVQLGISLDLPRGWSADWWFRHVSALAQAEVPAYQASTIRVEWEVEPGLRMSVAGQDLFSGHHLEWPSGAGGNVEIQPSVLARLTWQP